MFHRNELSDYGLCNGFLALSFRTLERRAKRWAHVHKRSPIMAPRAIQCTGAAFFRTLESSMRFLQPNVKPTANPSARNAVQAPRVQQEKHQAQGLIASVLVRVCRARFQYRVDEPPAPSVVFVDFWREAFCPSRCHGFGRLESLRCAPNNSCSILFSPSNLTTHSSRPDIAR